MSASFADRARERLNSDIAASTHLLLVGPTKSGKTDYVVQAIRAGFDCLYIDNDNGEETIFKELKGDLAAMQRITYIKPLDMPLFMENFFQKPTYRFNVTKGTDFVASAAAPDDDVIEIMPMRIPQRLIVAVDSWTSVTNQMLMQRAKKMNFDASDASNGNWGRDIYGPINIRATSILQWMQNCPFNLIVMAHEAVYEIKEKPPGSGVVQEKDMILKATLRVPMSTSNPHGHGIGKYFSQIGWMEITKANLREIDFRLIHGRVGAGTPNSKGDPRGNHSFINLFGKPKPASEGEPSWKVEFKASQWAEIQAARIAAAPKIGQLAPKK